MNRNPPLFTCKPCREDSMGTQPLCSKCDGTGFIFIVEGYGYPASQRGLDEIDEYFLKRNAASEGVFANKLTL